MFTSVWGVFNLILCTFAQIVCFFVNNASGTHEIITQTLDSIYANWEVQNEA